MRRLVMTTMCIAALASSATIALANDPDSESSNADVLTRARPEYDARGIRLGSFFLYPSLRAGVGYTDNVFNDDSGIDDTFFILAPQAQLRSGWSRHALNVVVEAQSYSYSEQSSEDRTDWALKADGRIDIQRGTDVEIDAHYLDYHEPRGTDLTGGLSPGDPAEPTELSRAGFNGVFGHTLNRVRLSAGLDAEWIDYEDTPRVPPAIPAFFDNDDRDRMVTELMGKVEYEATPDTAIFVRGRLDDYDFDTAVDNDGFNRDSSGLTVDGGVEFSMTHVLLGDVYVGFTERDYDDPAFSETSGLSFGAGLRWFPTMLTTVRLNGGRSIEDTSITAASGYVSTRGEVGVDHELLRNLILSGRLGFEEQDYESIVRTDDIVHASLGGRFLINNNFHVEANWEFIDRDSNVTPFDYSTNLLQLSLTGKL